MMHPTIGITELHKTDNEVKYEIILAGKEHTTFHTVTLHNAYWQKVTRGGASPEDFMRDAIEFLLDHEPQNAILPEFDVAVIEAYFPSFEDEMALRYAKHKKDVEDPKGVWHNVG